MSLGPESFFEPEGANYRASELTRGPWHPDFQHGGPPSALLAYLIEEEAGERTAIMQVARYGVELLKPVPVARLTPRVQVLREGKKVRIVSASLFHEEREVCRANALWIRTRDHDYEPKGQDQPTVLSPAKSVAHEFSFFRSEHGYHTGMELRIARGDFGKGPVAMWMRMRKPLLPGKAPSPLQRTAIAADSASGVSQVMDISRYTFLNPDLTIYLHRPAEGEWICLDARTIAQPHGVGLADTLLHDTCGPIGRSAQSLLIEER